MKSLKIIIGALALLGLFALTAAAQQTKPTPTPTPTPDPKGANGAQPAAADENLSGTYEGTAETQGNGTLPLRVEIKDEKGKLTGEIKSPVGNFPIESGSYEKGKVTLNFSVENVVGTITADYKDGKITGSFSAGNEG
ncbi:MAG: hypothetical protein WCB68_12575, partial [Pyrinomonadaceae bacterium]